MIKLTHLGQCHKLEFGLEPSPEIIEEIVESEIKVANYIKAHPDAFVFLESLTENYNGAHLGYSSSVAKITFPNGLPDEAAKLNSQQKNFLSKCQGAVRTMNNLGELNTIYRTITPEQSELIDSRIGRGDYTAMLAPRERAAMDSIVEVLKEKNEVDGETEVILVFGDAHDFTGYCREYGFVHEKISCTSPLESIPCEMKPPTPELKTTHTSGFHDNPGSRSSDDVPSPPKDPKIKAPKPCPPFLKPDPCGIEGPMPMRMQIIESSPTLLSRENPGSTAIEPSPPPVKHKLGSKPHLADNNSISGFEIGDKKVFDITDTIKVEAKCIQFLDKTHLKISFKENGKTVPEVTILLTEKAANEVTGLLDCPRELIVYCRKTGGVTDKLIADYLSKHISL